MLDGTDGFAMKFDFNMRYECKLRFETKTALTA